MRYQFGQHVDPLLVQLGAVLLYWAVVGVLALTSLIGEQSVILLALAPVLLLAIEAVVATVAERMAR